VEIEEEKKKPWVKRIFFAFILCIMEYNITTRTSLTSKQELRGYIGQFGS
jgi:hypothetical protein